MGMFADDTWTIGTADQDGQSLILRVRGQMPAVAERQRHAHLVVVGWPYDGADSGLPTDDDNALMRAFEDAVAAGPESGGIGIQVASITGAGHKEWRYYAADAGAFVAALNASLDGHPPYPLEIEMFDDSEWQGLQQLLDGLEEGEEGDEEAEDA
jgi:uncharacterized protein YfaP (DUF2135 family)